MNIMNNHIKPIDIVMQTKCFGLNDQILIRHEFFSGFS